MPRRKPRVRPWVWLSLTALIALLAFCTRYSGQPLQSRRLPDGSLLRIEAMTFGPEHRFVPGGPLEQLFALAMPRSTALPLGLRSYTQNEKDPRTPVLWITRRGGPASPADRDAEWMLVDPQGGERPITELFGGFADLGAGSRNRGTSSHLAIMSIALRHYPRRSSRIRVRRYSDKHQRQTAPVTNFDVANPYPGPYPQWTGELPPLEVRDPALKCTLRAFRNGVSFRDPTQLPNSRSDFDSSTYVEIETPPQPQSTDRWQTADVTFLDATGNVYERAGYGRTAHQGTLSQLWMPWTLPLDEHAWKVRVELARAPESCFRPEELWTYRNIPVPKWGAQLRLPETKVIDGTLIQYLTLDRGTPCNLRATIQSSDPGRWFTLVSLVDDQGRPVRRHPGAELYTRGTLGWSNYHYSFDIPARARSLTATFAYQRTRFVEFLAIPTRLAPVPRSRRAAR